MKTYLRVLNMGETQTLTLKTLTKKHLIFKEYNGLNATENTDTLLDIVSKIIASEDLIDLKVLSIYINNRKIIYNGWKLTNEYTYFDAETGKIIYSKILNFDFSK